MPKQSLDGTVRRGLGPDFWDNFDEKIEWGGSDYEDHRDGLNVDDDDDEVVENDGADDDHVENNDDVIDVENDAGDDEFSC